MNNNHRLVLSGSDVGERDRRDPFVSRVGRRAFLGSVAAAAAGLTTKQTWAETESKSDFPRYDKAQIAITLDLEMSRNFPDWEDSHWDYEKGNLNQAAKDYTVAACQRVKQRGGLIHNFVVGQVFEQESVDWLREISDAGHPIGNHTYDHVYVLAQRSDDIQYRFARSPWLIANRDIETVIRENIALAGLAIKQKVGVKANGFRTPGGFAEGLHGREDIQTMLQGLGFDWISCRYPAHAGMESLHGTDRRPAKETVRNILAAQTNAQPFLYPTGLLDIPMSPVSDIGAFRNGRWKLEYFLETIRMAIDWAIENRAMFDFLAHPSCLGVVDKEFKTIDLICELVDKSSDRAEIVTLDTIAQRARVQLDPQK
ncbi:polysaccharide deacetylase family protein [Pirellulales bacterium]|nr:polysaccharide deacetylase family protein [Pirellulales bacterium]